MSLIDWLFPKRAKRKYIERLRKHDEFIRSLSKRVEISPLTRPLGWPCWRCGHDIGWHGRGGCEFCDCNQEYTQMGFNVDHAVLYAILREWAAQEAVKSYTDLSHEYMRRSSHWVGPEEWAPYLFWINERVHTIGAPALSSIIGTKREDSVSEPGFGFWEGGPQVPARPKKEIDRLLIWAGIVKQVHQFDWPKVMP